MAEQVAKRPWLTANKVTLLRLVPMPILCWLIYQDEIWTALVLGTLIGCTDFIDGYLARKHGPTILGGLLDPMADKVFIALAYLPFADLGIVPAWAVALMFVREFVVTALRSAYEQRGLTMKTSYFAKVKTWTQMQGLGMLLLFLLLADEWMILFGLLIAAVAIPLVAMVGMWLVRRRFWIGALLMGLLSLPLLLLHIFDNVGFTVSFIMIAVVVVTWLSGVDYIRLSLSELRGRGDFGAADATRVIGSVLLPCALFIALARAEMPIWALITILALELSVGGLDNLLSHHKAAAGAVAWSIRVFGISALLLLGVALGNQTIVPSWLAIAAAILSLAGVTREFWRGRDYYLDRRVRDKSPGQSAAA